MKGAQIFVRVGLAAIRQREYLLAALFKYTVCLSVTSQRSFAFIDA